MNYSLGPHVCPWCNGYVYVDDRGDDMGPRCLNSSRSPDAPPPKEQLAAAGLTGRVPMDHATTGKKAPRRGRQAVEYSPAPLGLGRPLSPWRR